jgi:hypothetical protein
LRRALRAARCGALLLSGACAAPSPGDAPGPDGGVDGAPTVDAGVDDSPPEAGVDLDAPGEGEVSPGESGTPTGGCAGLPLCDDFEGDAPGAPPSAALWSVELGCNPNTTNSRVDGGLAVGVVDSLAHGGQRSLRVVGGDSCGYYVVNTTALKALPANVYARFWAQFSGPPTTNHNGFLSMKTGASTDQLRLGFQGDVMAWNYFGPDTTLPDIDPVGEAQSAPTRPGQWDCIELHLDQGNGHLEVWLNGVAVPGLGFDGASVQGVSDQWRSSGPAAHSLRTDGVGWRGQSASYPPRVDDHARGSQRIGCF